MIHLRKIDDLPYTTVPNSLAQDAGLSWKARGLLLYLLSLPDDWRVRTEHLADQATDGRHSLGSGLEELESAGYLHREAQRDEGGEFDGYDYLISPEPVDDWSTVAENLQRTGDGFSRDGGNPSTDNPPLQKKEGQNQQSSTKETSTAREEAEGKPSEPTDPVLRVLEQCPPDPLSPNDPRIDPMMFESLWRMTVGEPLAAGLEQMKAIGRLVELFPKDALERLLVQASDIHRQHRWKWIALSVQTIALGQRRDGQLEAFTFLDKWRELTGKSWDYSQIGRAKKVLLEHREAEIRQALQTTAERADRPGWGFFRAVLFD